MNVKQWLGDRLIALLLPLLMIVWRRMCRQPDQVLAQVQAAFGCDGLALALRVAPDNWLAAALRKGGAMIDDSVVLHGPLFVVNYDRDFSRLRIAHNVHVGSGVLFDLAQAIHIDESATIAMGCRLLTHQDVGRATPEDKVFPRRAAPLTIGAGTYIGAGAVILCGASVGATALVGAGAVVTHAVGQGQSVAGVPARAFR